VSFSSGILVFPSKYRQSVALLTPSLSITLLLPCFSTQYSRILLLALLLRLARLSFTIPLQDGDTSTLYAGVPHLYASAPCNERETRNC